MLHRVEVIEIAPVFLEAVGSWQRRRVVAEVVFAELAGGVTEIVAGTYRSTECRAASKMGLPGSCGGIMPVRSGYMPVTKALRPEVQLCMAT